MINHLKHLAVFLCVCGVITVLLATTNFITSPIIEKNQNAAASEALLEVMPNGSGFEKMDLSSYTLPATVTEVQKETTGKGYVITLVTSGYGTGLTVMCGVGTDGVVTGAVCLASNETLSKEKTYGENFTGKDAAGVDAVDTISNATLTTAAYKNAIKDALNAAIILGGGNVDIRTEEEILADNLKTAFPDGDAFKKLFRVETIDGVDAIYTPENGSGYVFVVGERFIGVKADGTVVAEDVENAAFFTAAVATLEATTYEEISLSAYPDLEKTVLSAKRTATGNYVLVTKGAGYGIKGGNEYHPASNKYIEVQVALTPDGKILDCLTLFQEETKGLGDACAKEEFYGQFVGKTEENYNEIDAIGGATLTTDGYKQAIERAFAALTVLEGGGR